MLEVELQILGLLSQDHYFLIRILVITDVMHLTILTKVLIHTYKVVRVLLILKCEQDFKVELNF